MNTTRRKFLKISSLAVALPYIPFPAIAKEISEGEWRFGIIPDTQWANEMGVPFYGTAIHVVDAINTEMIRQKVDFVIEVGDLVEVSSAIAFQTRANHNKVLAENGIRFFPLRGNHDSIDLESAAQFKAAFPDLPGTAGREGSSPDLPNAAGMTYAFTHNNVKFICIDTFPLVDDGSTNGKAYTISDYLPWIESELQKNDHHFAFVFSHKNLLGQNHKDNFFSDNETNQDSHPAMQNAFFSCLQKYGVRYFICGHDHMYHHSRIKSPDGFSELEQIICGSAAHKFYLPRPPFLERETPIAQELNRIGFLIVRVKNDLIKTEYFSTEPFGTEPKTAVWELRDSFGYTLDGEKFGKSAEDMKHFSR